MIVRLDGTYNAFPSLHAGFLVYTLALGFRLLGRRLHPLVVAGIGIWTALILYATLATKQHYVLDLLAGGMIGFVAHGLAWRLRPQTS
jgi:membrane-associated phospholipid phosphatase